MSVIDGATRNASHTGGYGQTQTVDVDNGPYPIAVDQRTDTIYVGNIGDRTASLINGATCNAQTISGCAQSVPEVPVEQMPAGIAVDQQTDAVYITSIVDGDVGRIDGRACTLTHILDCRREPIPARMGGWGGAIALDPTAGTAYVPNNDDDGTVSMFAFWRQGPVDAACRS